MEIAALILGIVSALIALTIGVITVVQQRRKRPRIRLGADSTSLSITGVSHAKLTVNWDGSLLKDPYQVRVRVSNTGSGDLSSTMFDKERPITVNLNDCEVVALLSDNGGWALDKVGRVASFGPDLLKAKTASDLDLIVDGAPSFSWGSHLTDVTADPPRGGGLTESTSWMQSQRRPFVYVMRGMYVLLGVFVVAFSIQLGIYLHGRATGAIPSPPPIPEECRQYVGAF